MIQHSFFWDGCKQTYAGKELSGILGNLFKTDFSDIHTSIETIYFPFCERQHWFVGVIDFQSKQIKVADSLATPPPQQFVQILLYMLNIVEIDTSEWNTKWIRLTIPRQKDSHSCGVAALSFIQGRIEESRLRADKWTPEHSDLYRLLWLERLINHHDPEGYPCDTAHQSPYIRAMEKVLLSYRLANLKVEEECGTLRTRMLWRIVTEANWRTDVESQAT